MKARAKAVLAALLLAVATQARSDDALPGLAEPEQAAALAAGVPVVDGAIVTDAEPTLTLEEARRRIRAAMDGFLAERPPFDTPEGRRSFVKLYLMTYPGDERLRALRHWGVEDRENAAQWRAFLDDGVSLLMRRDLARFRASPPGAPFASALVRWFDDDPSRDMDFASMSRDISEYLQGLRIEAEKLVNGLSPEDAAAYRVRDPAFGEAEDAIFLGGEQAFLVSTTGLAAREAGPETVAGEAPAPDPGLLAEGGGAPEPEAIRAEGDALWDEAAGGGPPPVAGFVAPPVPEAVEAPQPERPDAVAVVPPPAAPEGDISADPPRTAGARSSLSGAGGLAGLALFGFLGFLLAGPVGLVMAGLGGFVLGSMLLADEA